jgi:hypothetical protein
MFFAILTFLLFVSLPCRFTLFLKPGGQVLCPSVRILLDLSVDRFYDSRFLCFCDKKFLHFASPQLIIVVVLCNNVIKRLCEAGAITMCLPFPDASHVFTCIVSPYPFMSLLYYCRRIYPFMWRWLIRYSGIVGYIFILTAWTFQYTIKLILIITKKRYMCRQEGVIW